MFTGIIEELGKVKFIRRSGRIFRLRIEAEKIVDDLKIGDSIAVNGVCLTLVARGEKKLDFDVLNETASKTNIGNLKINDLVNLERALKAGKRFGGHFVNGHVDCIGVIRKKIYKNNNLCFEITFPTEFFKNVLEKGSIAVDGISLTIAEIRGNSFSVYVIPHTLENTTFKFRNPSSRVNLEFDILTKAYHPSASR